MKTILIFVSSLDGKVTKWGDPDVKVWSSQEDKDYYQKVWNEAPLIVMGSGTFAADRHKPSSSHLMVVMTSQPEKYKASEITGQLEFTSESPAALFSRFKEAGYERMLVTGGPHVAASFLKEQLIDEIWLTIEPKVFGKGGNFVIETELDIQLQLIHLEQVNKSGTLLTKYAVLKKNT
jgi:dihydrofolate reductase